MGNKYGSVFSGDCFLKSLICQTQPIEDISYHGKRSMKRQNDEINEVEILSFY